MQTTAKQNPAVQGKGIWGKLFQIQNEVKTFAITEDSEKTDAKTNKPSYRYTPGWKIVESVRDSMDRLGLMLTSDCSFKQIDVIEYPVYKMIGGSPMSFTKKEMHIALEASFTWVDVESGETAGPFRTVASGANGTDKSTASALALAERYFLLKFFHFTTRDADDEPNAHDSDTVPGIPKSQQAPATQAQACSAVPVHPDPCTIGPQVPYSGYGASQQFYGRQQPMRQPGAGTSQQVNVYAAPPQYIQQGNVPQPGQPFDILHPSIQQAAKNLAQFEKGTPSHMQMLNECIGSLSASGFICTAPKFIDNLTEAGQALRENRIPKII